jgi:hypothetical protein
MQDRFSFADYFRKNSANVLAGRAQIVHDAIAAKIKGGFDDHLKIELIIHEGPQLFYPAVIVAVSFSTHPDIIAYHTLVIETDETIVPRAMNWQGQTLDIARLPGDVLDRVYIDEIAKHMRVTAYPAATVHEAGARLVLKDLDLDNPAIFTEFLVSVMKAGAVTLSRVIYKDDDVSLKDADDPRIGITESFMPQRRYTPQGKPVRADFSIRMTALERRRGGVHERAPIDFAEVAGYVDIVPAGGGQWLPRFVATAMDLKHNHTLSTQLVMLAVAAGAQQGKGWVNGLVQPNQFGSNVNGVRMLKVLDKDLAESNSFEAASRAADKVFRGGFLFSLDIDGAGDDTWQYEVFARAAYGNQEALNQIYHALDFATAGAIKRYINFSAPICYVERETLQVGYFADATGRQLDDREVDTLMVMSLVKDQDRQVVEDFIASSMRMDIPQDVREERRYRIVNSLVGGRRAVDRRLRVTFTSDFLMAIIQAFRDVGLVVQVNRPADVPEAKYEGPGVMDDQQSGLFRNPQQGMPQYDSNTRW